MATVTEAGAAWPQAHGCWRSREGPPQASEGTRPAACDWPASPQKVTERTSVVSSRPVWRSAQ